MQMGYKLLGYANGVWILRIFRMEMNYMYN